MLGGSSSFSHYYDSALILNFGYLSAQITKFAVKVGFLMPPYVFKCVDCKPSRLIAMTTGITENLWRLTQFALAATRLGTEATACNSH